MTIAPSKSPKATKAPSPPMISPAPSAFPTEGLIGTNDASCAAAPACSDLTGNCCPSDDGVRLACCDQFSAPPTEGEFLAFTSTHRALDDLDTACLAHPECSHLAGDCCPTIDNVVLDCCSPIGPF